ncbi:MAG: aspartate aminotransferase family protein [Flavipsychrobacter sp.]|nr:aspartate aminotransferase family protein [Flavipsychrobacter sp.]
MNLFDVYPLNNITITKAQGSYVWDNEDRKYLDMYGGHAVISIGHTHPHFVNRLKEQLDQIAFYSNSIQIPLQHQLAKKLGEVSGKSDYQLFLCNSGAEANENAIKLASFHTGRKKIVAFSKGFHGRTSLAVAATDNATIIAPVNATDNVVFLPFNDVNALTEYFNKEGNETAAVIVEAIQGVGGINVASDEFVQAIRTCCNNYDAVCIADEVRYGRTGKFFAFDHSGVEADIYTMAKGMGNGFPVGGIAIAPHIKPKHGMLGTTFGGNHLACAAALAVLEVIVDENLLQQAEQNGNYLMTKLSAIDELKNIRGRGLMIGFDVAGEHATLRKELLSKHHIFTGEAKPNVIRLLPALNISLADIDAFIDKTKTALAELTLSTVG